MIYHLDFIWVRSQNLQGNHQGTIRYPQARLQSWAMDRTQDLFRDELQRPRNVLRNNFRHSRRPLEQS